MDIVLLIGAQAVGKMTVGKEIEKQTGLKLFHNHMTIDLVLQFMSWDQGIDLVAKIRQEIYDRVIKYESVPGLVITLVWAFELESEWSYVENLIETFKDHNFYMVELISDLETRLERNVTELRLQEKWTKRDTKATTDRMIKSNQEHRLVSNIGEITYEKYLRIDNSNLTPTETANRIIDHFNIKRKELK